MNGPGTSLDREGLVRRFTTALEAAAGGVRRAPDAVAGGQILVEVVKTAGGGPVLLVRDPVLEAAGAAEALAAAGVETSFWEPGQPPNRLRQAATRARVGVTVPRLAIADTGTLVLVPAAGAGRTVDLLPPVHAAVVPTARLVPDLSAALARLGGSVPPSTVALVTGPSRTADIELQLTLGVHGPGTVVAVLVDGLE